MKNFPGTFPEFLAALKGRRSSLSSVSLSPAQREVVKRLLATSASRDTEPLNEWGECAACDGDALSDSFLLPGCGCPDHYSDCPIHGPKADGWPDVPPFCPVCKDGEA